MAGGGADVWTSISSGFCAACHPACCGNISMLGRADWLIRSIGKTLKQTEPDVLFAAITGLAQRDRDAIITDFENVEQLCDMVGQIALHSVAARDARVLSLLQSADSNIAKSITLLLAARHIV